MTDKQVLEYIDLINRKLQILTNSGVNWKPEYAEEMKQIDARIAKLYPLVEELRKKKALSRPKQSRHKKNNLHVHYRTGTGGKSRWQ